MSGHSMSAQGRAYNLRKDLGLTGRTFDLLGVVRSLGIEVSFKDLQDGRDGFSLVLGSKEVIVVDPTHRTAAGRRFTLAHELGHHLLGHVDRHDDGWETRHGAPAKDTEGEANAFASELLMPHYLFKSDIKRKAATFEAVSQLAGAFEVSLTAAAIRFVTLIDGACALVGHHAASDAERKRSWQRKSRTASSLWLELPPGPDTLLASHVKGQAAPSTEDVPAKAWLPKWQGDERTKIREEVYRTTPGSWLALLSDLPDPEDDTGWEDRAGDEEREERRRRFSRY